MLNSVCFWGLFLYIFFWDFVFYCIFLAMVWHRVSHHNFVLYCFFCDFAYFLLFLVMVWHMVSHHLFLFLLLVPPELVPGRKILLKMFGGTFLCGALVLISAPEPLLPTDLCPCCPFLFWTDECLNQHEPCANLKQDGPRLHSVFFLLSSTEGASCCWHLCECFSWRLENLFLQL